MARIKGAMMTRKKAEEETVQTALDHKNLSSSKA